MSDPFKTPGSLRPECQGSEGVPGRRLVRPRHPSMTRPPDYQLILPNSGCNASVATLPCRAANLVRTSFCFKRCSCTRYPARLSTRSTWTGFQGWPRRVVWPSAVNLPAMACNAPTRGTIRFIAAPICKRLPPPLDCRGASRPTHCDKGGTQMSQLVRCPRCGRTAHYDGRFVSCPTCNPQPAIPLV